MGGRFSGGIGASSLYHLSDKFSAAAGDVLIYTFRVLYGSGPAMMVW